MAFTMKSLSSILLLAIPVLANLALNMEKRQSPVSATEFVDVGCGLPSGYSFTSDPKLPDPFIFANGTKVKSLGQFEGLFREHQAQNGASLWDVDVDDLIPSRNFRRVHYGEA